MYRASLLLLVVLPAVCLADDSKVGKRAAKQEPAPAAVAALWATQAAAASPWDVALQGFRLGTGRAEPKEAKAPAAKLPKPGEVVTDKDRDEVILSAAVQHPKNKP